MIFRILLKSIMFNSWSNLATYSDLMQMIKELDNSPKDIMHGILNCTGIDKLKVPKSNYLHLKINM